MFLIHIGNGQTSFYMKFVF